MKFVKIENPKNFFDKEKEILNQTIEVVRDAFASPMGFEDVYQHLTIPEKVYLLFNEEKVIGMGSYSQKVFSGIPVLTTDGIAIKEDFQGKGVFNELTNLVLNGERVICLRTQNPHMYLALEKKCKIVYPNENIEIPEALKLVRNEYGNFLNCELDEFGIARKFYGKSLYGKIKFHPRISKLFEQMKMNISAGDALIVTGVR
ncbi:hypothetical protein J4474_00685 [Candidatus Pacearchaeota archaeon]|nr:hypothetical protein [Candidatus Pacearchaeota archaeon]